MTMTKDEIRALIEGDDSEQGDTQKALAQVASELADLTLRVDLDAIGGHERDAVELVESRAEVARCKDSIRKLIGVAEHLLKLLREVDERWTSCKHLDDAYCTRCEIRKVLWS